jgi:Kelch motif
MGTSARAVVLVAVALALVPTSGATPSEWETRAALPVPRTEVAAAVVGNEIVVFGGLESGGGASRRVDAYSPARDSWRRLPDLPVGVHHSMAVGAGGRLHVLGGYTTSGAVLRTVFVLQAGAWRSLPRMPFPRAAAGAALAGRRIVVAGGIGEGRRLARNALAFDLRTARWSVVPGPTPREHLGVTALAGTVYAVAGRTAGLDTNLLTFESFRPGDRSWRRLQPVPDSRGGTGAAAVAGQVISVGGEEPAGTIAEVLAYRVAERRWVRLDDLPTPRHGVGVAALGGRVFVIGGGPEPGLTVSSANEALRIVSPARRLTVARRSTAATGLTFRRTNGSRIEFAGRVHVWCGAWNTDVDTRTLHVAVLRRAGPGFARPYWWVFAVAKDVERARSIRFPAQPREGDPRGVGMFVYDTRTGNEASSEEEESRGAISFAPTACAVDAPVRFTVAATLGSETGGKPIRVAGTFRGVVSSRPSWWPG